MEVRTHFNGNLFQSFLDTSRWEFGKFGEDPLQLKKNASGRKYRFRAEGGTDEHLPVVDGIRVLEEIKAGSDTRVLHVERETSVAVLELPDGLGGVVGIGLDGGENRERATFEI